MSPADPTLFDVVVAVDWSANTTPKTGPDSIWSCVLDRASGAYDLHNHATRHETTAHLTKVLIAAAGRRVLVGFDFAFGFPCGLARSASLAGTPPWHAVWEHLAGEIVDAPDNRNNRFDVASRLNARVSHGAGPFWGVALAHHVTPSLARTKAPAFPHRTGAGANAGFGDLAEYRLTELAMRATGKRPFSVWQLFGAGSVGSQALTGIPVVAALRSHPALTDRTVIWPFETGLTRDLHRHPATGRSDLIVHAEIWPSSIETDTDRHPVKDAAQVICVSEHLADLDRRSQLAAQFAPSLTDDAARIVVDEEGWILGAPSPA